VRRLDPSNLTAGTDAQALRFDVGERVVDQPMMLSASADVLVYASSRIPYGNRLASFKRSGEPERLWREAEQQNWPRVSPDGHRLARQRVDWLRGNGDIWVEDLERGTLTRVTTAAASDIQPVWSPDGRYLAYVSGAPPGRDGERQLNIAAADGTGVTRTLPCPTADYCEPSDWSADGHRLLVAVMADDAADVWVVEMGDQGNAAMPLLDGAYAEFDARLSPDGRWIAYVSEESGRDEISVRSIDGPPRRLVVSPYGGGQPVWRRDGGELFYVDPGGQLRSVPVRWEHGEPVFGLPEVLQVPPVGFGHWGTQYDVSPDGSRIYMLRRNDDPPPREIHVIIGWRALLD
jgi:dipeptidyl aminopeptidase/acylaminoacyl peptidase